MCKNCTAKDDKERIFKGLLPSRFNLLENKVVLAVVKGNSLGLKDFTDLKKNEISKIALVKSDDPFGQY